VDWPNLFGPEPPVPTVSNQRMPPSLGSLFSGFDHIIATDDPDVVVRRAVEVAREQIGFPRAGLFLLDRARGMMLGTWGTDISGQLVDEHHIMYVPGETELEAFRRSAEEHAPFTIFKDAPIIENRGDETVVHGRGWVAYTPIRSGQGSIGMLFNDAGTSGVPVNATKQGYAAILCALLGTLLNPLRAGRGDGSERSSESPGRRLVTAATAIIAENPGIGGKEVAARLAVNPNRLTRAFRDEMGMSVVEYRNRLRLDLFSQLLQTGRRNLLDAALASGFGSYAQFHRVFRAMRGASPSAYLARARAS